MGTSEMGDWGNVTRYCGNGVAGRIQKEELMEHSYRRIEGSVGEPRPSTEQDGK